MATAWPQWPAGPGRRWSHGLRVQSQYGQHARTAVLVDGGVHWARASPGHSVREVRAPGFWGTVLTEAVAGGGPAVADRCGPAGTPDGDAGGEDGRLGVGRALRSASGPLQAETGDVLAQGLWPLGGGLGLWEAGPGSRPSGELRALAREDQSKRQGRRSRPDGGELGQASGTPRLGHNALDDHGAGDDVVDEPADWRS